MRRSAHTTGIIIGLIIMFAAYGVSLAIVAWSRDDPVPHRPPQPTSATSTEFAASARVGTRPRRAPITPAIAVNDAWMIVGAPSEDWAGLENVGRLHAYRKHESGWRYHGWFAADTPAAEAHLGHALAIRGEHLYAPVRRDGAESSSDAVIVFACNEDGDWHQVDLVPQVHLQSRPSVQVATGQEEVTQRTRTDGPITPHRRGGRE